MKEIEEITADRGTCGLRARFVFLSVPMAVLTLSIRLFAQSIPPDGGVTTQAGSTVPSVPFAETPPVIDGRLDDAAWLKAMKFEDFKTFKPDYGKAASQRTVAYLTYDSENIYFAARAFDSEPSKIKTSVCRRDAMGDDDLIGMILDTFNDMQSGYGLMLNPYGIQGDGILNSQGNLDDSLDLVWYSKGMVDEQGYTVEAQVPLKSLRFPYKKTTTMRVIFFRFITRNSEQVSDPPLAPDKGSPLMQSAPVLFHELHYKRVAEFIPAFTFGNRYAARDGSLARVEENKDFSLTGKLGLTSDLILDAAYNPDFSQVEADAGQIDINLRYQLYYQEKRPFFLEGADLWSFGGQVEDSPLEAVVYTRTIINPDYGFKLTGKITRRDTLAAIYARDNLPGDASDQHPEFLIARYKHSLKGDSHLGAFYAGREAGGGYNRVGGADGALRLNGISTLSFHAFGALTREPGGTNIKKDHALSVKYDLSNRRWALNAGYQDVSQNFRVDTGFVTRTGLRRISGLAMYRVYPKSRFIQKIEPFYWSYHIYDTVYGMWETCNLFVLRFQLPRSTEVRFEGIAANEVFAGARFDRSGFGFRLNSQVTKQLFVFLNARHTSAIYYDPRAPYQGYGNRFSAEVGCQPVDKFNSSLSFNYSDFYRRAGGEKIYAYTIVRSRNTYQLNKYLFLRGIAEYNFYRQRLTADGLVSFTYIPGTVFYAGYGSAFQRVEWNGSEYVESDRFLETSRGFFFKLSYLWRF